MAHKQNDAEMRAAAGAFFQSVYELPCADAKKLREEERAFMYKHQRMMLDLRRAKFDPSPTYTLLLAIRQRLPGEVWLHEQLRLQLDRSARPALGHQHAARRAVLVL